MFNEIFKGSSIIKAFGVEKQVLNNFEKRIDEQINCHCHEKYSEFGMFYQVDLMGVLVINFTVFAFALFRIFDFEAFVNADTIGISLSNLMIVSAWISFNTTPMASLAKGLASVERILNWIDDKSEIEDDWVKKGDPKDT